MAAPVVERMTRGQSSRQRVTPSQGTPRKRTPQQRSPRGTPAARKVPSSRSRVTGYLTVIRPRVTLDKYRIECRLSEGGFSDVYRAFDTVEGVRVALKVPHDSLVNNDLLESFRSEARMVARLEHPNILPLKNANVIDGRFVIAYPLGTESLADRMGRRMSLPLTLNLCEQMLEAVAYAHSQRIVHCDVKPENMIMFPGPVLRLADFGIAKVAWKTLRSSGTGTVGYMAPEQAMGQPSQRSDVFSLGLIIYRMLSGAWPAYPFEWPGPNFRRLKTRASADMVDLLKKATDLTPRKRYADAGRMLADFRKAAKRTLAKSDR